MWILSSTTLLLLSLFGTTMNVIWVDHILPWLLACNTKLGGMLPQLFALTASPWGIGLSSHFFLNSMKEMQIPGMMRA